MREFKFGQIVFFIDKNKVNCGRFICFKEGHVLIQLPKIRTVGYESLDNFEELNVCRNGKNLFKTKAKARQALKKQLRLYYENELKSNVEWAKRANAAVEETKFMLAKLT